MVRCGSLHAQMLNPLQITSACGLTEVDSIYLNRHCAVKRIIIQFIQCALGFKVIIMPLVKKRHLYIHKIMECNESYLFDFTM